MKDFLTFKFRPGRRFVIGVPFLWLLIFFVLPCLILLRISVTDMGSGVDPFAPLIASDDGVWRFFFKYDNYAAIFWDVSAGFGQTIYW
jgi:putrescine transport system permease protein